MNLLVSTVLANFLLLVVPILASAQSGNIAGRVVSVANDAYSVDESGSAQNQLARRSEVYAGDTIFTDGSGMIQIRMIDAAIVSLQCNSALKIEDYWYEEDVAKDLVTLRLLSGRFRTITGAIGEQNSDRYRFYAGSARIEVRGTDFEVFLAEDGTMFIANYDGSIMASTVHGEIELGIGADSDFAKIEPGKTPELLFQYPQQFVNTTQNSIETSMVGECKN